MRQLLIVIELPMLEDGRTVDQTFFFYIFVTLNNKSCPVEVFVRILMFDTKDKTAPNNIGFLEVLSFQTTLYTSLLAIPSKTLALSMSKAGSFSLGLPSSSISDSKIPVGSFVWSFFTDFLNHWISSSCTSYSSCKTWEKLNCFNFNLNLFVTYFLLWVRPMPFLLSSRNSKTGSPGYTIYAISLEGALNKELLEFEVAQKSKPFFDVHKKLQPFEHADLVMSCSKLRFLE